MAASCNLLLNPLLLPLLLLAAASLLHPRTCRATTEEAPACRPASWRCGAANSLPGGDVYGIALDSESFEHFQLITVKVYMKQCPTLSTPGPLWYRLTAVDERNSAIGEFIERYQRSETFDCPSSNSMIFSTCEPFALDLPRRFEFLWRLPEEGERACFRLSVLTEEDGNCTTVTKCIEQHTPGHSENGTHNSTSGDMGSPADNSTDTGSPAGNSTDTGSPAGNSTDTGSSADNSTDTSSGTLEVTKRTVEGAATVSEARRERCLKNNNCTGKPIPHFGGFCGSDNRNYSTRCHAKLQRCLYQIDITLSQGLCEPPPPPTPSTWCQSTRERYEENGVPYTPVCTCDDFFKPVQCNHDGECWCSLPVRGSLQFGTKRPFSCTDPETFEFPAVCDSPFPLFQHSADMYAC